MSSFTATITPAKGYFAVPLGSSIVTTANQLQSLTLTTGVGTPSCSIGNGKITASPGTTITTSPASSANYIINSPLLYVVNNSGLAVVINSRSIPTAATVVFVLKPNGSYGLLDTAAPAIANTVTSVI